MCVGGLSIPSDPPAPPCHPTGDLRVPVPQLHPAAGPLTETLTVMRGKLGSLPASSRMCAGAGGTMKGPRGLPGPTPSP